MKNNKDTRLLTRKEAAEFLSISLTTLKTWTTQKMLKGYSLGGRVYYKENEIVKSLKPFT